VFTGGSPGENREKRRVQGLVPGAGKAGDPASSSSREHHCRIHCPTRVPDVSDPERTQPGYNHTLKEKTNNTNIRKMKNEEYGTEYLRESEDTEDSQSSKWTVSLLEVS
jgi:hypothetical protein